MMQKSISALGEQLARVLGVKLDKQQPMNAQNTAPGRVGDGRPGSQSESPEDSDCATARQSMEKYQDGKSYDDSINSISSADAFIEDEPTVHQWFIDLVPSGRDFAWGVARLFPFTQWITRYNGQWLSGDLVAGITVGCVVVPQSMAYAKLAELDPQFGLYSSFMGVLIYWFFATSKDITIGPVAVMSTVTGNVVSRVRESNPEIPGHVVASALAVIAGAIICFIGLIRCGWIVEFISLAAISAFMTGSALNIAVGQVPALMGITGFDSRASTYKVVINVLKHLDHTKIDAAMGLTALLLLYLIRSACNFGARRLPRRAKLLFFISTLRTAFVILLYTMISWLVNRRHKSAKQAQFSILGRVPRGFQNAAVPTVTPEIIQKFLSDLPVSVIVLLIEHIAIAKSFGRVNNYTIDPSQEMVAIGITNLLGPFLGAYPATGSFSRTAIKSKAGVRTPFAGVITAVVVLLAIYALPAVFFYIPNASLAAVIIHAVGDLITPPKTVYRFWRISPVEVIIFFAGVIVTVFSSIENGIYTTVCVSLAVLLFRLVKARGRFMGRVKVHSVLGDHLVDDDGRPSLPRPAGTAESTAVGPSNQSRAPQIVASIHQGGHSASHVGPGLETPSVGGNQSRSSGEQNVGLTTPGFGTPLAQTFSLNRHASSLVPRTVFLPIDHKDGSNPDIDVVSPYPGIFIYRFSEGFNYPNANHYLDYMVEYIFKETRRTNLHTYSKLGDRPWNDPGPGRHEEVGIDVDRSLPTLRAIVLDFSSVNNVDITSVQHLIDVRNQLDRYAAPDQVDWHFACINNRWTKRALASAGFGYPSSRSLARSEAMNSSGESDGHNSSCPPKRWKAIFSVAEIGGQDSAAAAARQDRLQTNGNSQGQGIGQRRRHVHVEEGRKSSDAPRSGSESRHLFLGSNGLNGSNGQAQSGRVAVVHGVNRPLFHIDLTNALQSAIANVTDIDGRRCP